MYFKGKFVFLLIIFFGSINDIDSKYEFTNIKCNTKDKTFLEFEYCYIKSVNRSYKYISLKAKIHQLPINDASGNLQILRRFRTYMPITMNVTVDVCKYMASKKNTANPMLRLYEEVSKKYSNYDHKCPYDHDIEIEKLPIHYFNKYFTDVLPLPLGDYAFYSSWYIKGIERATVWIYSTIS